MDFPDINSLEGIARYLEILPINGEPEQEFRKRLAEAFLDRYGDTVAATEILTGKDCDRWTDVEEKISMGIHILHNKSKKERLQMQGDTYYSILYKEFEELLKGVKFEKVFSYSFQGSYSAKEEFAVWTEKNKALLLKVESYFGVSSEIRTSVNSTELYYELSIPKTLEELDEFKRSAFSDLVDGCRSYYSADAPGIMGKNFCVDFDAREGLLKHLDKLDASGFKTNNPWRFYKKHDLWLCDYIETSLKANDWKEITRRKVNSFPEDVRKMIGFV